MDKGLELVGGGSVINRAYPVYFFLYFFTFMVLSSMCTCVDRVLIPQTRAP